jgi:hypothetical protein
MDISNIKKIRFKFLFIIIPLCLLLYKGFIEEVINNWIVLPLLSHAKPLPLTDSLWITLGIGLISVSIIKFLRGYVVSNNLFLLLLIITTIYSYYRFVELKFFFYGLSFLPCIYYFDLLFLVFLLASLLKFISSPRKKIDNNLKNNAFIIDQPINNSSEDLLKRKDSAQELAKRILATPNEKAFAIGVNGQWGSGKTSYLNLIKEALPSDIITINFNPWRSLDSTSLIKDFFNTLAGELKGYSTEFSDVAKLYSQHLSDKDHGMHKVLNQVFLLKDQPLGEYYQRINDIIKKLNKKIIIFIDDLDRLDKEEIYEVLKLIRNTADFNYVSYIVAYDKNYINQSLSKLLEDDQLSFLEKIFQVEHHLPFSKKAPIIDFLYEHLTIAFPEEVETFKNKLLPSPGLAEKVSLKTINNIRDAKRFLNSFIYGYSKIKGEVEFVDFFNLEILKVKYQLVYEDLYKNSNFYLSHYKDNRGSVKKKDELSIEEYLKENQNKLCISENSLKDIKAIFDIIFKKDFFTEHKNPQSISLFKNFYKYFTHELHENDLSENEFNLVRYLPYGEFTKKIKEWINQGKRWDIIERFKRLVYPKEFKDKDDFEKIIKSIFFIANCTDDRKLGVGYQGYPDEDIYNKITQGDKKEITKKFYNGNEESYKDFLRSIFNNAVFPFYHESELIDHICMAGYREIAISKEELRDIQVEYFKKATEQSCMGFKKHDIYPLYHRNVNIGNQDKINVIFRDYLEKGFLKYYLTHIISIDFYSQTDDPSENKYHLGDSLLKIFNGKEEFESYLNTKSGDPIIDEFKQFYEIFKKGGWKPIQFKFEHIPVSTE